MQEKISHNFLRNAAEVRSIAEIERDVRLYGNLLPETRRKIIDEEKTHAAEILAGFTKRGCVPREYYLEDGKLVDEYGYSLDRVIEFGVKDTEEKIALGVPGADKELLRRQAELHVLRSQVMVMPPGSACIEWSATDNLWSEEELRIQGYPGDTHVRLTVRVDEKTLRQYNIILQGSDLRVINKCRRAIHPSTEPLSSALEILQCPLITSLSKEHPDNFVELIRTEFSRALLSVNKPRAALNMLKVFVRKRKDAWSHVNDHDDIFDALVDTFEQAACINPDEWRNLADQARGGAWQLLVEGLDNKITKRRESITTSSVAAAGQRAAAAGAVFTACGGTVSMKPLWHEGISSKDRVGIVKMLLGAEAGHGVCGSCQDDGELKGCGVFCEPCNEVWCEEFLLTGRQLQPEEIMLKRYLSFFRSSSFFR